ncbi:hypothetical protein BKA61DRAFT_714166 [Leptodontidium sp. MPI-SDFR-AT-0119]|nr:hypothetical protein BKA61DRAFT_714166 [Leptodontidium sp. MPI-SDFR-AT-0119]
MASLAPPPPHLESFRTFKIPSLTDTGLLLPLQSCSRWRLLFYFYDFIQGLESFGKLALTIVFSIGYDAMLIVSTHLGLGVYIWNVPFTTFSPDFLLMGTISGVFYGMSFILSPYKRFRIAVWVIIVTTVVYSIFGSFEFIFLCQPIAKSWDLTIIKGKCINPSKILMGHGSINLLTDVAMLVLPIALVRKLKMQMKQKVALACLFMTGTLYAFPSLDVVCIVSAIRLKFVLDIIRSPDPTWLMAELDVWSFKPFLRRHFPKVIGSSYYALPIATPLSRNAANTFPRTLTDQYELGLCDGHKSGIPRKSKQQTCPDNESQEDILGDGFPEGMSRGNEAKITSDCELFSQKGSFRSDRSGVPPACREEGQGEGCVAVF